LTGVVEVILRGLVVVSGSGLDIVDLVVLGAISQESLFWEEFIDASCSG
jgi:hypothetical protein